MDQKVDQPWEALRWVHAFFLVIESHLDLLDNNHVFKKRDNILQLMPSKE